MNGDISAADIASSNAYDALRKIEDLQSRVKSLEYIVMSLSACVTRAALDDPGISRELKERITTLHRALDESGIRARAKVDVRGGDGRYVAD
jgi:hypothetical protein